MSGLMLGYEIKIMYVLEWRTISAQVGNVGVYFRIAKQRGK